MDGPPEFFDVEAILLQVLVDGLVESLGHVGLSVEDPEVVVVGAAHNRVSVVLIETDDPVVCFSGSEVKRGKELNFKFGVRLLCILWVREGLSN